MVHGDLELAMPRYSASGCHTSSYCCTELRRRGFTVAAAGSRKSIYGNEMLIS